MKVLFLTLYPESSPSSRFRVYQYEPFLKQNGIDCVIKSALPNNLFTRFYNKNCKLSRLAFHSLEIVNRFKDIIISGSFDLVFVQKGLVSINLIGMENVLSVCNKKIVFDFDDAVFSLTQFLPGYISFIQDARQVEKIIRISRSIIAGNSYLSDFARKYNSSVSIIPTSINTDIYVPGNHKSMDNRIIIGWTGSSSTNFYLNNLIPVLNKLARKYPIKFKIISKDLNDICLEKLDNRIELEFVEWKYSTEVVDLQDIDIGTMPLNDNEWSRGKCGLKALQFMSLQIPVVCSPVGVNTEIICDAKNGFLAYSEEDWFKKLSLLIENESLRRALGEAGRNTVEERYSLKVNAPKFKAILEAVAS